MNRRPGRIGAAQLYAVLLLSVTAAAFTSLRDEAAAAGADPTLIRIWPYGVFGLACGIPIFYTRGRGEPQSVTDRARALSPACEKAAAAVYVWFFLWHAALGMTRLDLFLRTQLFRDVRLLPLMGLFALACAWAAARGLEALARAAVLFSVLFLLTVGLIVGAALPVFSLAELPVFAPQDAGTVFRTGLYAVVKTPELAALLILMPRVSGNVRRGYALWLPLTAGLIGGVRITCAGVLGAYAETQAYPFYTLTSAAGLRSGLRLDDLLSAAWILCAFTETALFFLTAAEASGVIFRRKPRLLPFFCAAPAFALYAALSQSGAAYRRAAALTPNALLFAFTVWALPLCVTAAANLKKRRLRNHEATDPRAASRGPAAAGLPERLGGAEPPPDH